VTSARHRELLDAWQQRAGEIRYPPAKAVADLWIGRSLCCSGRPGDLARGLELLQATCTGFPNRARAALEYTKAAITLPPETPEMVRSAHMLAASQAIDDVLRASAKGEFVVPAPLLQQLREAGWWAAALGGDVFGMVRLLPLVEPRLAPGTLESARAKQRDVEAAVETFKRQ
jgi:hypothetical protein